MTDLDLRFSVNEADVIAESLHGETLIINLNSGAYYTSDGAGDQIWQGLSNGMSVREVVEHLRVLYPEDAAMLGASVLGFIEELRREGLIVEEPAGAGERQPLPNGAAPSDTRFAAPKLEKYTDFQELLMLDPIHQVHEVQGWPAPKPD